MVDLDLSDFILAERGHPYEFFVVGQVLRHHWGRTITAADSIQFSTSTCAWNPLYLNREFARADGHPDLLVNPALLLCTAVGLSVEDLSESGGPFLSVDDVTFQRSVYPDVTITATSMVEDARLSSSRPDNGIVTWQTTVTDESGATILSFRRTNLVRRSSSTEANATARHDRKGRV
ncbi:MaoC family dehydratase [Aeromicrobium sp. CTD01-1L150]|uniref:MaoC family dehydratase n=1 Tax=Aeromicrobium sp. CTD01-1L150 TaxID=3341830 RepID=UPI0035C15760